MTWLIEFSRMNAVFHNQTWTFIEGQINHEIMKITNKHNVIGLYAIRQIWLKRIAGKMAN